MVIGSLQKGGRFLASPCSSGKMTPMVWNGATLSRFSLAMQCFQTCSLQGAANVSVHRATSNPIQVHRAFVHWHSLVDCVFSECSNAFTSEFLILTYSILALFLVSTLWASPTTCVPQLTTCVPQLTTCAPQLTTCVLQLTTCVPQLACNSAISGHSSLFEKCNLWPRQFAPFCLGLQVFTHTTALVWWPLSWLGTVLIHAARITCNPTRPDAQHCYAWSLHYGN